MVKTFTGLARKEMEESSRKDTSSKTKDKKQAEEELLAFPPLKVVFLTSKTRMCKSSVMAHEFQKIET